MAFRHLWLRPGENKEKDEGRDRPGLTFNVPSRHQLDVIEKKTGKTFRMVVR